MSTAAPLPQPAKFSKLVEAFARGALDDEATAALAEVADAVNVTGKAGTLTVKFKVSVPKNAHGEVFLDVEVDAKPPKTGRSAVYFVQPGGALSRRDPNQPQLPGTEDQEDTHV